MESEVKRSLFRLISAKLKRVGMRPEELGEHFDMVRSGLVNSLEFVEMVATLEKEFQCEIDYEAGLEEGDLTTVSGLLKTFEKARNG